MPLSERIASSIRAEGDMRLDAYMRAVLLDEREGFYAAGNPIGRDFTTAPETSQMFGELLGLWCAESWRRMGCPAPFLLVEMGPGRGVLMRDALRAIGQAVPECAAVADVHLVEASALMRRIQEETLQGSATSLHWHDTLGQVPSGVMLLLANEFFDALPSRQFCYGRDGGWRERRIGLDADGTGLVFRLAPCPEMAAELEVIAPQPAEGEIVELCAEARSIAEEMAARLRVHAGAALLVDYGAAEAPRGETLSALRNGASAHPLQAPGAADVSLWVDFRALAQAGQQGGAEVFGPIPQGRFLRRLGIAERAAALNAPAADLLRLVDPQAMGAVFKAMAFCSEQPNSLPSPGFLEEEKWR